MRWKRHCIRICSLIVEIQICSSAPELSQNRNAQLPCLAKVEIATVQNLSLFLEPQRAFCAFCGDRIWGLGRQGFKCTQCKLLIHKKCHKLIRVPCDNQAVSAYESSRGQQRHEKQGSFGSGNGTPEPSITGMIHA